MKTLPMFTVASVHIVSEYLRRLRNAVRALLRSPCSPYVLINIAAHNAAAFLSWHRYLLHIYEKELQTVCGYTKALP